jgi:NAD-dependent deacetylase
MQRVVIFSGAGLSAESGIPTFRDTDGLWEQHRIEDVATPEGWARNPELVLEFYRLRFEKMKTCRPNAAHVAITELQAKFEVINLTQNIDDLLERAGSLTVWHLHGRIDHQKCERHHDIFEYNPHYLCDFKSEITRSIKFGDKCPKCQCQVRPDVVWFGESVDLRRDYLDRLIETTDVFIGIGTSAQVYPAAGLLNLFTATPKKFFIDPNPAYHVLEGFEVFSSAASEGMPMLVKALLSQA